MDRLVPPDHVPRGDCLVPLEHALLLLLTVQVRQVRAPLGVGKPIDRHDRRVGAGEIDGFDRRQRRASHRAVRSGGFASGHRRCTRCVPEDAMNVVKLL
jgi:hypothetical protein